MGVIPARVLSWMDGSATCGNSLNVTAAGLTGLTTGAAPLGELFDVIFGTSTGGLLGAGIAVPDLTGSTFTGNDAVNFYADKADVIFPGTASASGPKYQNDGLIGVLSGRWGNPPYNGSSTNGTTAVVTMSEATTPVFMTSCNVDFSNTTQNNVWAQTIGEYTAPGPLILGPETGTGDSTGGAALSVFQACLMTSAFPTLLPSVPYDLDFVQTSDVVSTFVDGGVWAGNPAMAAYLWAKANGYPVKALVSLGCGTYEPAATVTRQDGMTWGAGAWNPVFGVTNAGWLFTANLHDNSGSLCPSFDMLEYVSGEASGMFNDIMLQDLLDPSSYFRINPVMPLQEPGNHNTAGMVSTFQEPWDSNPSGLTFWATQADAAVQSASAGSNMWSTMMDKLLGKQPAESPAARQPAKV